VLFNFALVGEFLASIQKAKIIKALAIHMRRLNSQENEPSLFTFNP
jgi:hypothetical protein